MWCLMCLMCLFPFLLWSLSFVKVSRVGNLSFSFSKKRAHCCTITQEEMRFESTQVKAPPCGVREKERSFQEQNSSCRKEKA